MDRDTYIAPFIHRAFNDETDTKKRELMREFWDFFDALELLTASARFDSEASEMVESDSHQAVPIRPL